MQRRLADRMPDTPMRVSRTWVLGVDGNGMVAGGRSAPPVATPLGLGIIVGLS
jgi:hypothetical protein